MSISTFPIHSDCLKSVFQVNADSSSVYNTPPVYSVYIMKLVFEWIDQQGGAKGSIKVPGF